MASGREIASEELERPLKKQQTAPSSLVLTLQPQHQPQPQSQPQQGVIAKPPNQDDKQQIFMFYNLLQPGLGLGSSRLPKFSHDQHKVGKQGVKELRENGTIRNPTKVSPNASFCISPISQHIASNIFQTLSSFLTLASLQKQLNAGTYLVCRLHLPLIPPSSSSPPHEGLPEMTFDHYAASGKVKARELGAAKIAFEWLSSTETYQQVMRHKEETKKLEPRPTLDLPSPPPHPSGPPQVGGAATRSKRQKQVHGMASEGFARGAELLLLSSSIYESPLSSFRILRMASQSMHQLSKAAEDGKGWPRLPGFRLDPSRPVCKFDVRGSCKDVMCAGQHLQEGDLEGEGVFEELRRRIAACNPDSRGQVQGSGPGPRGQVQGPITGSKEVLLGLINELCSCKLTVAEAARACSQSREVGSTSTSNSNNLFSGVASVVSSSNLEDPLPIYPGHSFSTTAFSNQLLSTTPCPFSFSSTFGPSFSSPPLPFLPPWLSNGSPGDGCPLRGLDWIHLSSKPASCLSEEEQRARDKTHQASSRADRYFLPSIANVNASAPQETTHQKAAPPTPTPTLHEMEEGLTRAASQLGGSPKAWMTAVFHHLGLIQGQLLGSSTTNKGFTLAPSSGHTTDQRKAAASALRSALRAHPNHPPLLR